MLVQLDELVAVGAFERAPFEIRSYRVELAMKREDVSIQAQEVPGETSGHTKLGPARPQPGAEGGRRRRTRRREALHAQRLLPCGQRPLESGNEQEQLVPVEQVVVDGAVDQRDQVGVHCMIRAQHRVRYAHGARCLTKRPLVRAAYEGERQR